jgi:hypothetical protein
MHLNKKRENNYTIQGYKLIYQGRNISRRDHLSSKKEFLGKKKLRQIYKSIDSTQKCYILSLLGNVLIN